MNNKSDFTIDVEKVLHDKAGRHARYVPQFVISWLKRLIHQDEMNEYKFQVWFDQQPFIELTSSISLLCSSIKRSLSHSE